MKFNFPIFAPYLEQAFSDGGSPSSSRLLTAVHSLVACAALAYVVIKTRVLPDGTTLAGLGAFSTVHYFVNRATTAFGKDKISKPDVTDSEKV